MGHGGKGEWGSVGGENLPAPTTAPQDVYLSSESNETSTHGDISIEGSETLSSDESCPVPTMVRTAERLLESRFPEEIDGEELGRTRAQTRALNQDAAVVVRMLGPCEEGRVLR